MTNETTLNHSLIFRIQNALLPLARGLSIFFALGSIAIIIGGSVYALYLQSIISRTPSLMPIPQEYSESLSTSPSYNAKVIDLNVISNHLIPPRNIAFTITIGTISTPVEENMFLGYFSATTLNGLAALPEGMNILGGA